MIGDDIFRKKVADLERRQDKMLNYVSTVMERQLLKLITDALNKSLKTDEEGNVLSTEENLRILEKIDQVFSRFDKVYGGSMLSRIVDDFNTISAYNYDYFDLLKSMPADRYKKYASEVDSWLKTSIGLNKKGVPVSGGYLDNLVNDKTLRDEIKTLTYNAVSSQMPLSEFTEGIYTKLTTTPDADGWLTRYYRAYAYDKYQEYDRANNKVFANKLGLTDFIYAGGLIDDSREFCKERNNKVFTLEEAQKWKDDPDLPKSKAERESGTLEGYVPELNMGRWRCRHVARFVSKEMASEFRKSQGQ